MNFTINKWLLLLLILLLSICILYCDLFNMENMENIVSTITVRKLSDFTTEKTHTKYKIINLKCTINNEQYYLGNIHKNMDTKNKIGEKCFVCDKSKFKDQMLILCNSSLKQKHNCLEKSLELCYNENIIVDCNEYAKKECSSKKLDSEFFEFTFNKLESPTDTENDTNAFLLSSHDSKMEKNGISILELDNSKEDEYTKELQKTFFGKYFKEKYAICCDKIDIITETNKIYVETENLPKDKIQFKLYFNIKENKKYIGKNTENCNGNFLTLTVYDNANDPNVLVFEPEMVKLEKI